MRAVRERYYKELKGTDRVDHKIIWLTDSICGKDNPNGFIAQHMIITSHIDALKPNDYWEAWKVIDCKIEGSTGYDDNWSPIPYMFIADYADEIIDSSDGKIEYYSRVYYIPATSPLYLDVEQWRPCTVHEAGDLRSVQIYDKDIDAYYLCDRKMSWNYKELLNVIKKEHELCLDVQDAEVKE